jgi:alanine dehydrogenase
VLVDIAIDQGGCFADSRPTTHDDPTYRVHDSVFYCVANMPGAVPHTSTYVLRLAELGWEAALAADPALAAGLSTHHGALHCLEVAHDLGLRYTEPGALLPA